MKETFIVLKQIGSFLFIRSYTNMTKTDEFGSFLGSMQATFPYPYTALPYEVSLSTPTTPAPLPATPLRCPPLLNQSLPPAKTASPPLTSRPHMNVHLTFYTVLPLLRHLQVLVGHHHLSYGLWQH
jgi:hypothetical protein